MDFMLQITTEFDIVNAILFIWNIFENGKEL